MKITQLSGRHIDVTPALRAYIEQKLERLDRFGEVTSARVTLTVKEGREAARRNRIEVQLNVPGGVLRAEEAHADMYAAIDRASDVLERQLRKFKTRTLKQRHTALPETAAAQELGLAEDVYPPEIVRQKRFEMRPMTPEDAALQMEDLGHDFYVFSNMNTGNCGVVYRRKDGHYGLIEPK
ncbi:ribosome hibernation-promoting factor, HPF/YfiA family [Deinococcus lacus]|uniref:Ribosome hibernation promoting factor n=1 Tax=Deinococcus lacus TaxID=392561 RepID=A0ABW1YE52_9DEIO